MGSSLELRRRPCHRRLAGRRRMHGPGRRDRRTGVVPSPADARQRHHRPCLRPRSWRRSTVRERDYDRVDVTDQVSITATGTGPASSPGRSSPTCPEAVGDRALQLGTRCRTRRRYATRTGVSSTRPSPFSVPIDWTRTAPRRRRRMFPCRRGRHRRRSVVTEPDLSLCLGSLGQAAFRRRSPPTAGCSTSARSLPGRRRGRRRAHSTRWRQPRRPSVRTSRNSAISPT